MRKLLIALTLLALPGCGKFLDKFSRLDEHESTVVTLDGGQNLTATMNGGIMIYFAREGDQEGGRAYGFTSSELAQGQSVVVPNGNYKVWAFGSEQGSGQQLEGQAKCGIGNGGAIVPLAGGATTVSLNVSAANCGFGNAGPFGEVDFADTSHANFDTMNFQACSTQAFSSCDTNTGAFFRVRMRLLAGEKQPNHGAFLPSEATSLLSACSPAATAGIVTSNILLFAGGSGLSPPMELLVYNSADTTCSGTILARIRFEEGLRDLQSVTSGAAVYLDAPVSSNVTTLKFKYP